MATGRGGNKIKSKLGFLVYGEQGTWKSSLCLEFMKMKREDGKPFRVLYIDAEQGSIDDYLDDYADEGYDLRNIYIVYTQSLSEVKDFIKKAKKMRISIILMMMVMKRMKFIWMLKVNPSVLTLL